MNESTFHISEDVTNAKECAVPKDKFEIRQVKINMGPNTYEDMVHTEAPYFHFQILRFKDEDQRDRSIEYFKEHQKLYSIFEDKLDGLLYVGCSRLKDIRSGAVPEVDTEELKNIFPQAVHWYRFYGKDVEK